MKKIKHTALVKNESEICPCCNSRNIFTWVANNEKNKIHMVTCENCKFECTANYKYARDDNTQYNYL